MMNTAVSTMRFDTPSPCCTLMNRMVTSSCSTAMQRSTSCWWITRQSISTSSAFFSLNCA